ncbi:MAG: LPXTG-motif cell wall anchor domain protein, partial [Anaerocolumna sp.]|nr:LPXTG-motif cell wall anchor domain protein [Anaerocolumna sp.]
TSVLAGFCLMMLMTVNVFAATTDLLKDGEFLTGGFINAGEAVDGAVSGPGNWTQLNMADSAIEVPYLHVIVKATGDTAAAQIAVSDAYTFNLADLGVTLTEEYQDVVLPVADQGLTFVSWMNFTGLDGGSSVYTIKDVFLSDDAASTTSAAVTTAEETSSEAATTEVPKTGESNLVLYIAVAALMGSVALFAGAKKLHKEF